MQHVHIGDAHMLIPSLTPAGDHKKRGLDRGYCS